MEEGPALEFLCFGVLKHLNFWGNFGRIFPRCSQTPCHGAPKKLSWQETPNSVKTKCNVCVTTLCEHSMCDHSMGALYVWPLLWALYVWPLYVSTLCVSTLCVTTLCVTTLCEHSMCEHSMRDHSMWALYVWPLYGSTLCDSTLCEHMCEHDVRHKNTTTKTPPHHHKNTTTPPQKHHKNTTTTPPHHHTTTKTPPHHHQNTTTKTPPHHHQNTTTKTPPQKQTPPQKHHHTTTKTPPHHHKKYEHRKVREWPRKIDFSSWAGCCRTPKCTKITTKTRLQFLGRMLQRQKRQKTTSFIVKTPFKSIPEHRKVRELPRKVNIEEIEEPKKYENVQMKPVSDPFKSTADTPKVRELPRKMNVEHRRSWRAGNYENLQTKASHARPSHPETTKIHRRNEHASTKPRK